MNSDGGPLHNGIQYCGIVPYLGIFLSDFTFLDEGSQTFSSPGALPSPFSRCAVSTALVTCRARQFEKSQAVLFDDQENQRVHRLCFLRSRSR
jgi:hypothetical protein